MTCTLKRFNTTRFGEISYNNSEVITFGAGGLLGFENETRYVMVDPQDSTSIQWMQSLDNPAIAFPLLKADMLFPELVPSLWLAPHEAAYHIMTIPNNVTEMTVNTRAPIIMDTQTMAAVQRISTDKVNTQILHPVYAQLRHYIVHGPTTSFKETK